MKRRILTVAIFALFALLPSSLVMSSIDEADYYGVIRISNNSTAAENVTTVMTLNTTSLIEQGWADNDLKNLAIIGPVGADVAFMPSVNATIPWSLWVDSIAQNANMNYTLYTGNISGGKIRYFPGPEGMTSANFSIGDNFTIEQSGWWDTTAVNTTSVNKTDAFRTYTSATGNITSEVWGGYLEPTDSSDPGEGWTDEAKAYDNKLDTFAYDVPDPFNPLILKHTGVSQCTGVKYYAAFASGTGNILIELYYGGGWNTLYSGALTNNTWTTKPLATPQTVTQAQITFSSSAYDARLKDFDFIVNSGNSTSVTAPGLPSGEYIIKTTANVTDLAIYVGTELKASTPLTANMTDNAANWTFCSGGSMRYLEYQEITINGTVQQRIEWENNADIFTDNSTYGHHTAPSFRTISSDLDVSAKLISFQPVATARAPTWTITDAPFFITENATVTGNFTGKTIPAGGPPGAALIDEVAEAGGTPPIWLWGILGGLTIVMSGLFISFMERKYGSGGGSLLLRISIATLVIGILITFGKFDFWMLVLYLFIAIAIAMASRHTEWGGNITQLNLVGFLAMSWVGLTTINRILEGQFIKGEETSFMNTLMFTQEFQLFGMFKIPVLNFQFFTQGIPMLLKWDYSFFQGNAQLIQYLLYSFTAVMSFIVFLAVIGMLYNYFSRLR